ncbi:MAG: hypothetical protein HKL92_00835 [Candidatus Eremiobacteraeota bacterium]|nr:hypothetical protein [Candidatus Eremiobacteraeota bacterium]
MSREREAEALDERILATIEAWHHHNRPLSDAEFDDLALAIFAYQLRYDTAYAAYCAGYGLSLAALPSTWREIPPIPARAYKEAAIAAFPIERADLVFESSGTTLGEPSRHYIEDRRLYDAALLAGFERAMLGDGARLRYLLLVPNPAQRPHSSLGYMMGRVAALFGDGETGWYLDEDRLLVDAFIADARDACDRGQPICLAATAFSLLHLVEAFEERGITLQFPGGSRVMETGGFKGRARVVTREELYARASRAFALPIDRIVAEYGMSEICSQYYDRPGSEIRIADASHRIKYAPPWLRTRALDERERDCPPGTVGALAHVDLANRSSCLAVLTEDLGALVDGGIVLLGRESGAQLRGCSLDAEDLRRS